MSEFNNNQTPPNNSYNWNGDKNNRKKSKVGTIVVIVAILLCLAVAAVSSGVMILVGRYIVPYLDMDFSLDESVSDESGMSELPFDTSDTSSQADTSTSHNNSDYSGSDPSDNASADLSTDLTDIYEKCAPACCTIKVKLNGMLYSIGSGFVYDADNGYIATNHHVIESGDEYSVEFYNGNEYTAALVGSNDITDLAVLHIDATDLPSIGIGDSNAKKVGENVVAIGTPYDESLAGTMTCGVISGIARDVEITNNSGKVIKTMTLIQTDCSINPGNSGGPLIDMAGNVIGITSLKLVDEQFEGIGFAIPITEASDILNKLIRGEIISDSGFASATPQIGITVSNVDDGLDNIRVNPRCEYPQGVLVMDISARSSAYAAGLERYDIITELNGEAITSVDDLSKALKGLKAGETVTVRVFRFNYTWTKGGYYNIEFKLDAAA